MSKRTLTTDEALALVIKKELIHTFMNPSANVLIGAHWTRDEVVKLLEESPVEVAGKSARGMGHGIAANRRGIGFVFIETDEDALNAFDKEIEQ